MNVPAIHTYMTEAREAGRYDLSTIPQDADVVATGAEAVRQGKLSRTFPGINFTFPFRGESHTLTYGLRAAIEAVLGERIVGTVIPGQEGRIAMVPQSAIAVPSTHARSVDLSVGVSPESAAPVFVYDSVIVIGYCEAKNRETGEPVTIHHGASNEEIKDALRESGALSSKQKFYNRENYYPKLSAKKKPHNKDAGEMPDMTEKFETKGYTRLPDGRIVANRAVYYPKLSVGKLNRTLRSVKHDLEDIEFLKDCKWMLLYDKQMAVEKGFYHQVIVESGWFKNDEPSHYPKSIFWMGNIDYAIRAFGSDPDNLSNNPLVLNKGSADTATVLCGKN